jgi:selenocysteine-specific translation elongation factor
MDGGGEVNLFEQPTWKELDEIARKHNPRVHHCQDETGVVAALKAKEKERQEKRQQMERISNNPDHMRRMTAIRSTRREQMIDAVGEYISKIRKADAIRIGELMRVFERSDSTISEYVSELLEDERIRGERVKDWTNSWLLWGRD